MPPKLLRRLKRRAVEAAAEKRKRTKLSNLSHLTPGTNGAMAQRIGRLAISSEKTR